MKDTRWLLKRIDMHLEYSEFCKFYLKKLEEVFKDTKSRSTRLDIIKAGKSEGIEILSKALGKSEEDLDTFTAGLYGICMITNTHCKQQTSTH